MPKNIKIEIDGKDLSDNWEAALEAGFKGLKSGGEAFAKAMEELGATIEVSEQASQAARHHRKEMSREARRAARRGVDPASQMPVVIPPESSAEWRGRFAAALLDSGALWTLGGMMIAAYYTSNTMAFAVGGGIFYVALAAEAFQKSGRKREKVLRQQLLAGVLPPSMVTAPQAQTAPFVAPDSAIGLLTSIKELAARIRSKLKPGNVWLDPKELDAPLKIAQDYTTKHSEITAFLATVGGTAREQADVLNLRTQLETIPADDSRRAGLQRLLTVKEQTLKNLRALEEFQRTVETKLAEQLAQLQSLETALMTHQLGSFQHKQQIDETYKTPDLTGITQGMSSVAHEMQTELHELDKQLA